MEENEDLSKEEVIQLVAVLSDQEKHFNGLETNYRLLASTWLLGSLGTIGYLLISTDQLTIDFWLLIGLVGAAGGIGIILLWVLDALVYHKLLDAVFVQGILLEMQYDWLPKVRTNMIISQKGKATRNTNLYYTSTSASLFFISLAGFINYGDVILTVSSLAGFAALVIAAAVIFFRSVRNGRTEELFQYVRENFTDEISKRISEHKNIKKNPHRTDSAGT